MMLKNNQEIDEETDILEELTDDEIDVLLEHFGIKDKEEEDE